MTAAEALLRWQHATRGLVPPTEFIALAEDSGVIVDIGAWVLETACEQAAQWTAAGWPIKISVNVSARQLDDPGLVRTVSHALNRSGLDPDQLVLEITETALMRDAETAADVLGELTASGVHIAIDDFGTGYSSLAYLQQFPVDALKIDRTFIAASSHSPESDAADPDARPARPQPRPAHRRRGHRGHPAARTPAGTRLRPRPGLPVRTAARGRRARALPGRPDARLRLDPT